MKKIFTLIAVLSGLLYCLPARSQVDWPQSVRTSGGTQMKIYEWQPESFDNGRLKAKAAISIIGNDGKDPVFGMAWIHAQLEEQGDNWIVTSIDVEAVKLPGDEGEDRIDELSEAIGNASRKVVLSKSSLSQALSLDQKEEQLASQINNAPPSILYTSTPSVLVLIDGTPRFQRNSELDLELVVNSPFTIVRGRDDRFYLYGGKHWYRANAVTGPYSITTQLPSYIAQVESKIRDAKQQGESGKEEKDNVIYSIIVRTEPTELVQSDGEPDFAPLQGTNLLYIRNSDDDIFMDIASQQYFLLLSGRWYKSNSLNGKWQFTGSDRLPKDFSSIPEGSPKDRVLASVAGTEEARNAVMDADVPQTAKVDRNSAKADIQYDGDPEFEDIEGTDMEYAVNSPDYVIRQRNRYYAVENGVWFESRSAYGPWYLATRRPSAVSLIPPRYPVYQMKYVYIYDVTPDYIYAGYTRGYLNNFVYGPTIVYGTGYQYDPWFRTRYFARPYTWGFHMRYDPWVGWGLGVDFGWFSFYWGNWRPWDNYYWGGWWGPRYYCPPPVYYGRGRGYGPRYYGGYGDYGYYGRRNNNVINNNTTIINNNTVINNNNIYNNRRDVVTVSNQRPTQYANGRPVVVNRSARASAIRTDGSLYDPGAGRPSRVRASGNNSLGNATPGSSANSERVAGSNRDNRVGNSGTIRPATSERIRRVEQADNNLPDVSNPRNRPGTFDENPRRRVITRDQSQSGREPRVSPVQREERSQPVQRSEPRVSPVQREERSQPVQRSEPRVSPVQREERSQPVQRSEPRVSPVQREERSQPVQRSEPRVSPVQREERSQPVQRSEPRTSPVQRSESGGSRGIRLPGRG